MGPVTDTSGGGRAGFFAIVPAGGAGTRLWPLSRAGHPKFLLDLTGSGRTLLQQTWDRLVPLTGTDGVLVVTGAAHAKAVAGQLDALPAGNLLAEPSPRDSTAAICLAAAVVRRRDPDAVVGSFAADAVIRDVPAFHAAVGEAVAAAGAGYVVTIGIEPDHPSTAFGYIRLGAPLGVDGAPSAHVVERFVEKPDAATAAAYLAEGTYRWNAGMFVARADVLLDLLAQFRPGLAAGLETIAAAWDTDRRDAVLAEVWPTLEKVAIDYALAEPAAAAGRVAVVPAALGWDDVGDFAALADLVAETAGSEGGGTSTASGDFRVSVLGDGAHVLSAHAGGFVVPSSGRVIAVIGLEDVVVVDTPDAVLVTTRAHAQAVKAIVDRLKSEGRHELT
ncbi:mannose-1-phosphate guanylyltransferase [Kineosporia sp. R_H_3]|uniref:mannose-1-phosphate guanylyltransferase n=1 Tax=Kineosporia sp. R_H_3 TaxID=1961848 RepID=UPI00350F90D7